MLRLKELLDDNRLYIAALRLSNKVAYDRKKGFTTSWDSMTYWEYAPNLGKDISFIKRHMIGYEFNPYKEIKRKVKTRTRMIYIATWRDRLLESCLADFLNYGLKDYFNDRSFAYRSDRFGVYSCQKSIAQTIKKSSYFVRRDIKSFFYSIDQNILLNKISGLVDADLFSLLKSRINFYYKDEFGSLNKSEVGLAFGSPLACVLANIYMTDIDNMLTRSNREIEYYRYADDMIICASDRESMHKAMQIADDSIKQHKLEINGSKSSELSFKKDHLTKTTRKIKFLGLEYLQNGISRLPVEKRRKIMNIILRSIVPLSQKIERMERIDDKIKLVIDTINIIVLKRIRYAAIIDYYLNHITDEEQLREMDLDIAGIVIGAVLKMKFRKGLFRRISFKKLRSMGLISLRHRSRKLRHGIIKVPFLSMFNMILIERELMRDLRKRDRINNIKMFKILKDK